jgi:hypothetical protein
VKGRCESFRFFTCAFPDEIKARLGWQEGDDHVNEDEESKVDVSFAAFFATRVEIGVGCLGV